jgi:hypothetical protein
MGKRIVGAGSGDEAGNQREGFGGDGGDGEQNHSDLMHGSKRLRRCVTMDEHWRLVRTDPEYRRRSRELEREIRDWIRRYARDGLRTGLVRIPVVVHVLYNTAAQNIPDSRIQGQIDVLNADFRRLNSDAASTPAVFAGIAADARFEFALAVRDPNCNLTIGITRTSISVTGWTYPGDGMKSTASGGVDPWDVTRYLNMWVVNYTDGTLGYGTFPSMPAAIQGLVCDYRAFGLSGSAGGVYNLGRTATHEIGHYFNLLHIWGDDGGACSGSDLVDDTPNQADHNFGCPGLPHLSCSNGPNGDMFMNYMDYTDDACMNMFSAGQVVRMDAALNVARNSLIASDGLVPPTGATPDLWMQDVSDDFGAEPDPSTQPMYISNDIWCRTSNDGVMNQDHQNPEYRPPGSASNYVYVRVRNRGCQGSSSVSGTLMLYWAKASSGLSWPSPWDGSVTSPALMGSAIGSQPVSVAGGADQVLIFPWMPPNPADYASFGADRAHFCLLARIETSLSPPYGMTSPETSNLYANVQNNNNIVWKNIEVVDNVPGSGRSANFIVANYFDEIQAVTLVVQAPKRERPSIFDWGHVYLDLPKGLVKLLSEQGDSAGVRQMDEDTFEIVKSGAVLGPFELSPEELFAANIRFVVSHKRPLGVRVFPLDVIEKVRGETIGGLRLLLKTMPDHRGLQLDCPPLTFDGVTWIEGGVGSSSYHNCGCWST